MKRKIEQLTATQLIEAATKNPTALEHFWKNLVTQLFFQDDLENMISWLKYALERGTNKSELSNLLGAIYIFNPGLQEVKAEYYSALSNKSYREGLQHQLDENYFLAKTYYEVAAGLGNVAALKNLAWMHNMGLGMHQDEEKATVLLQRMELIKEDKSYLSRFSWFNTYSSQELASEIIASCSKP